MEKKQRRSDEVIAAEVKRLKEMKPNVRRWTSFGDDNWGAIEIEIAVLEKNLSEHEINDRYVDYEENSTAYDAFQWREGEDMDYGSPADQWQELVKK